MKLPAIPLPAPAYEITVSHPSPRIRRAGVCALRFLLWGLPTFAVELALGAVGGGRHARWLTIAAACAVLAISVLTVGVSDGGGEDTP